MADQLYLGTGMKFPPQVNPTTGRFVSVSGAESVKESVYLILMTQKTERFMRPDFGTGIMAYTFTDTSSSMLTLMENQLSGEIMRQEPRVGDVTVTTDAESKPGCLFINISYTLQENGSRENMVFPFYLNTEPEEESEPYETMDDIIIESI